MSALVFLLVLLAVSLVAAPLLRRQLRAERVRWAKEEEARKLYSAVSGKVLVTYGDRWDIVEPRPGIIPEGTVVLMQPSAFEPPVPVGLVMRDVQLTPPTWTWDFRMQPRFEPIFDLNRPRSFIPPSVS